MNEELGGVVRQLEGLFGVLDPIAKRAARQLGATCKKGCASCCYQLNCITLPEGFLLARHLLGREDADTWAPRLREAAIAQCYEGIDTLTHWLRRLPCVFLDSATSLCRVYSSRPSTCRYFFVISDPACCADPKGGHPVQQIDLQKLADEVVNLSVARFEYPATASLPIVVLHCMEVLARGTLLHAQIAAATEGIPDPRTWFETYGPHVARERSAALAECRK